MIWLLFFYLDSDVSGGVQAPTEMRCEASFCYRGNAEGVFEVTLTKSIQPEMSPVDYTKQFLGERT